MTTSELEKLRSKLPKHYRMILWRRLNRYSLSDIKNALKGNLINNEILDAAIQLAEEYQNEINSRSVKIENL